MLGAEPPAEPLGDGQLAATADVLGSFACTPAAGNVLHAGDGQPLSVTFTPADAAGSRKAWTAARPGLLISRA